MAVIRKPIGKRKTEKVLSRKKKAEILTYAAAMHFSKRYYGVNVEQGVNKNGKLRADVLCMNLKTEIIIGEVKSCYADFRSDSKWPQYLKYCNKFYFIIFDTDVPKFEKHFKEFRKLGVGVLALCTDLDHDWYGWMYVVLQAKRRKMNGKKGIICRMAWRGTTYNKSNTRRYRIDITKE